MSAFQGPASHTLSVVVSRFEAGRCFRILVGRAEVGRIGALLPSSDHFNESKQDDELDQGKPTKLDDPFCNSSTSPSMVDVGHLCDIGGHGPGSLERGRNSALYEHRQPCCQLLLSASPLCPLIVRFSLLLLLLLLLSPPPLASSYRFPLHALSPSLLPLPPYDTASLLFIFCYLTFPFINFISTSVDSTWTWCNVLGYISLWN